MKNVILPTDFSDNAWKAMCYAAQLYHKQPINYHVLHTVLVPYSQLEAGLVQDVSVMLNEAEEELNRIVTRFKELDHHNQSEFKVICRFAALADVISMIEEELGGETTIVMGTKGVTGAAELFLGTMSSHVVAHSKSHVVVVPSAALLKAPERMMFAIDDQGINRKEEVEPLIQLALDHKAFLKIVNVPSAAENILEFGGAEQTALSQFFMGINHGYYSLDGEYKEDELIRFAESNDIHLLVMIKRKRGFWENLFHHSLTKSMVFHSDLPIFILKE